MFIDPWRSDMVMCGGIESPGDCQTPLVFVAAHDTLRAVVRHRQDVLHGTGLDLLVAEIRGP